MKYFKKFYFGVVCILGLVISLTSCKTVDDNIINKCLTYMQLTKTAYEKVVVFGCPYLQNNEKYDQFVTISENIKKYWNLSVDALEVYLQNKDSASQEKFIINIGQFKDLITKIENEFNLKPRYKLLLDGIVSASTILAQSIVGNLEITNSVDQSLDRLKITATCQDLPRAFILVNFKPAEKFDDFPKAWKEYQEKYNDYK